MKLLFEAGLTGIGLRVGLLPGGILDGLDLLVHGVEATLDATHGVTRHVADLIPLFLNLGELLTGFLGFRVGLDRHQSLGLDQQRLLGGQILLLGGVDLIAVGLTGVEESVGGLAELGPQGVVLVAAGATGLLPTVHQLVELAGGLAPGGGILQLVGLGDDGFLGFLGLGTLVVASLRPLAAGLVERGASGGEALPQCLGLGLVDADGGALVILPFIEQVAELVRGGTPVGVVAQGGGQCFGLLHDGGAFLDGLGHGGLAGLGQFGLLGLAGGLQRLELFLERGDIAHDCGLGGLLAQQLQGLVDLTGFDIGRGQAAGQQIKLGLEIQETTGVQRQGLFLGGVRELADLAFGVALLDEDGAVVVHAAEGFSGLDIGVGVCGVRGRGRNVGLGRGGLLSESGGGGRMRLRH